MKWAMVCSVDDPALLPQLEEFGIWLCESLAKEASELGLTHQFDPRPEIVLHSNPLDHNDFIAAYEKISNNYPGVMVIFQILPSQKSCVYTWMKELTDKTGKIRQGIVLENALSKFGDHDLNEVLVKVLHWISRCLSQIISNNVSCSQHNLRVGPSKETTMPPGQILKMNGVESVVHSIIHSYETVDKEWPLSSVKVSGFPAFYNQYQLASIFYSFNVASVHFEDNFAIVCFVNKFHAAQAVMLFDNLRIDAEHLLRVTPLHQQIKEQIYVI